MYYWILHQYYTTIYEFRDKLDVNFDNIKIFSVVRNPYDRIISDLFWNRLIKKDFTANQVYDIKIICKSKGCVELHASN